MSSLEDEKTEILAKLKQESEVNLSEFITKSDLRRTYFNVLNLLKTGNTEDKAAIIDTILNRVIVYKDRLEIFINLLPVATKLLLCDEPTGALDSRTSRDILELLEEVNRKYGTTMLIVTHNNSIKHMVDQVVYLKDGQVQKNYRNEEKVPAAQLEDL